MALSPQLLEILACPEDKGPLYLLDSAVHGDVVGGVVLYNPRLRLTYEVRDDIPIMLIEESTDLDEDRASALDRVVADHSVAPTFSTD